MANNNNNNTASEELQMEVVPFEELSDEMELKCPLKYGITLNGTTYNEMVFRRPKAADIKRVEKQKYSDETEKLKAYMRLLATQPTLSTPDEVDQLCQADLTQVIDKLFQKSDFFGYRVKKTSME